METQSSRRWMVAGLVGLAALGIAGCDDDDNGTTGLSTADMDRVTLGTVAIESSAGDLPAPPGTPDAQMQLVLTQIAAANLRPLHTLSPQQARNQPTFADTTDQPGR
ncbi:MAG: hypothetical protein WKG32_10065 [Gemmatimonadaceae bacterium]